MTNVNAMIIGLGSMGRRRARLLLSLEPSAQIVGIDLQPERRRQAEDELGIRTMASVEEAYRRYRPDMAFVSTSPLSHASIIKQCIESNLHVFTELNLTDEGYDENTQMAKQKGLVLFLSSTFLYRKEIQYIKTAVDECDCRLSYIYHSGQYLPDWHPWENYQDFFVGDKRTNGCRESMAIELPWLVDIFGEIKSVTSICSKNSSLDIDFPDTYQIMLDHESGHKGMMTVDIVSRKAVRKFELLGENLYLTWNGTPDSLLKYDFEKREDLQVLLYESVNKRNEYSAFIIEDAYTSEIASFLNAIQGKEQPKYSFEKDKKILSIIDEIERGRKG